MIVRILAGVLVAFGLYCLVAIFVCIDLQMKAARADFEVPKSQPWCPACWLDRRMFR